jgi:hypothetical protein
VSQGGADETARGRQLHLDLRLRPRLSTLQFSVAQFLDGRLRRAVGCLPPGGELAGSVSLALIVDAAGDSGKQVQDIRQAIPEGDLIVCVTAQVIQHALSTAKCLASKRQIHHRRLVQRIFWLPGGQEAFFEDHEHAFRVFGGVPAEMSAPGQTRRASRADRGISRPRSRHSGPSRPTLSCWNSAPNC